jgi:CubicO group peptidase (beta-lactamase class C family)
MIGNGCEMKKIPKTKTWLLAAAALLLLAGLGALAWFLIPGLHAPPAAFMKYPSTSAPPAPPVTEYWPTDGWRTSTPEQQGFDSVKLAEMLQTLHDRKTAIDSLLIIRNGYEVLDAYYHPYEDSLPHDLASVTKSVTTTLIAIAAGQGKLQLDQPMVSYFPDRVIANLDDLKKSITVRNLAGMVNGMTSGCLNGDESTLNSMRSNPDWVQAALDRTMTSKPGIKFCYDSPGMHLLSAILQETTGMTEFDFARQNLFEPLGIREVFWETDPQGYTHGWGDLHLKPGDAARIGYLWLNNGVWEGRQIVPADWVTDAVKAHSRTGRRDNYGYGWWVSDDSFSAMGRGGQNIKVYPALQAIVVTTASDFDYAQIDGLLAAAFKDPEKPLPANPAGVAKLNALLTELKQGPASQPAAALPDTAIKISEKNYLCEPNPVNVVTIRLEANEPDLARLYMNKDNMDVVWPIGLDGKFRLSPAGEGLRGYWKDAQTFIFEVFDIGLLTRQLIFKGDTLEVSIPEAGLTLKCQFQNP